METADITPQYAANKITTLIDAKRYEECTKFISRIERAKILAILKDLPLGHLHVNVPRSLNVLDAIYSQVHSTTSEFPIHELRTDELLKNMVILFSRPPNSNNKDKNCNLYFPHCRNILRVITSAQRDFYKMVKEKKKQIDLCMIYLGKHGMVNSVCGRSGAKLMNLHDALKVELDRIICVYKQALHKLEDFNLSARHPSESSVTCGPAPIEGSHQRMLQIHKDSVQDRLIKNKTLFNLVEPAVTNKALSNLILILEKRIEYDKMVLLQESELRKLYGCDKNAFISVTLRQYSQAYSTLIQLIHESCEDLLDREEMLEYGSSEEELYATHGSVYSKINKLRSASLDALDEIPGGGNFAGSERVRAYRISSPLLAGGATNVPSRSQNSSPLYANIERRDVLKPRNHSTTSLAPPVPKPRSVISSTASIKMSVKMEDSVTSLKAERDQLKKELLSAKEEIKKLEEREKQLRERLSDQVQKQFVQTNQHFENLTLGNKRPTELIRQYGNLYTDGRLDALDALDDLKDLEELNILKTKILFSVIVLAFRSAEDLLTATKSQIHKSLNIPDDIGSDDTVYKDILQHIDKYLQETFDKINVTASVKCVCKQIYETLFDYPCLRECVGLVQFVEECVQIALGLSLQRPPYIISFTDITFNRDKHVRFHTSDESSASIKNCLWPSLLEGEDGVCVSKGFVVT